MKQFKTIIQEPIEKAMEACGYNQNYGKIQKSNRPDLCQYQCNGALALAKSQGENPRTIAKKLMQQSETEAMYKDIDVSGPGFLNITLKDSTLISYIEKMMCKENYGHELVGHGETIIIDYGGPNIAKPLHIGHLRTAIIGESIKRMGAFLGYQMLGDVHLGDWGLQIGLIIAGLEEEGVLDSGDLTMEILTSIYPKASARSKVDNAFLSNAKEKTNAFQQGKKEYVKLWKRILELSKEDIKKNYDELDVHFELWGKESDVQGIIPDMMEDLTKRHITELSQGAVVVDIMREVDKKTMPPCILVKSDGATLYGTTDLATILDRVQTYQPKEIVYVVDQRQELHFQQVFRTAKKAGYVEDDETLTFVGFGTMNGKDNKPYKTRDGGVMPLHTFKELIKDKVLERTKANTDLSGQEAKTIASMIAVAAIKYGDLSNQCSKDYIFDMDRFTSFEGNTGPYLIYTVVRIKAIINKFQTLEQDLSLEEYPLVAPKSEAERQLMLTLTEFNGIVTESFLDKAPHKLCHYTYELAQCLNRFYHTHNVLAQEEKGIQASWIKLLELAGEILTTSLDLLGIKVPHRM